MAKKLEPMVVYQGRSVPKNSFRAFVYNESGQHLAQSYEEFRLRIASKEWYESKADVPKAKLKKAKQNDADSPGVRE